MSIKLGHLPVSVIIPCYCCVDTIERALDSVTAQTKLPAEILLIDDASPDDKSTLNKLYQLQRAYSHLVKIKVISLSVNGGPAVARNVGWDAATQPYLAFLDNDDSWHPRKLEIQAEWMQSYPEVALTGHQSIWLKQGEKAPLLSENWCARPVKSRHLLFSNLFATRTVMIRRDLPYRFEASMRRSEDYLLWLQVVLGGYKACRLELPLAYQYKATFGEAGLSGDLWKMEKGELKAYWILRQNELIGFISFLGLATFSFGKFLRRKLINL